MKKNQIGVLRSVLTAYLWWAARKVLDRRRPRIIAITGSSGKTSMKVAVAGVLQTKYSLASAAGNLNTEIGVPLAILGFQNAPSWALGWIVVVIRAGLRAFTLTRTEDILILECATDKVGDIGYLAEKIKPDDAIITSIGEAHIGRFGSLGAIEREKLSLCRHVREGGRCFLTTDILASAVPSRRELEVEFFGKHRGALSWVGNARLELDRKSAKAYLSGTLVLQSRSYRFRIRSAGVHYQSIVAGAALVGLRYGIAPKRALAALAKITFPHGRLELIQGKGGRLLIDDAYNANPQSARAALTALRELARGAQLESVAILGDMRDLGGHSAPLHATVGAIAKKRSRNFIAIGEQAKAYGAPVWFPTPQEALPYLLRTIPKDSIVLVKASRGGGRVPFLTPVIEALKQ